jgi:hypothetical protein
MKELKINLNNTTGFIKRIGESLSEPLDVFRIISLPTPRSWTFKIEFDINSINHLHIQSDPPLTDEDLYAALDGRLPSLYGYKALCVKFKETCFKINFDEFIVDNNERETAFIFLSDAKEIIHGQLKIIGYPSLPMLQREYNFKRWVNDNTWFGCEKFSTKNLTCNIVLLGNEYKIRPEGQHKGNGKLFFKKSFPIYSSGDFLGNLAVRCDLSSSFTKTFRHARYGHFKVELIDPNFWRNFNFYRYGSIDLEVDENSLNWFTTGWPYEIDMVKLKKILNAITELREKIENSSEYREFVEKAKKQKRVSEAELLRLRQDKVEKGSKVFFGNSEIMKVPSCENEVVALYMKIEGARKLPFECKVIEYTSQKGIDALANFQIRSTDVLSKLQPVEFEYILENFFDLPPYNRSIV